MVDQFLDLTQRPRGAGMARVEQASGTTRDLVDFTRRAIRLALQRRQVDHGTTKIVEPVALGDDALADLIDEAGNVAALQCESAATVSDPGQ